MFGTMQPHLDPGVRLEVNDVVDGAMLRRVGAVPPEAARLDHAQPGQAGDLMQCEVLVRLLPQLELPARLHEVAQWELEFLRNRLLPVRDGRAEVATADIARHGDEPLVVLAGDLRWPTISALLASSSTAPARRRARR